MSVFESVSKELNRVGCPSCHKHNLEISLRCTFGGKMCLFAAQCRDCEYLFELTETTRRLARLQLEQDERIGQTGCPACGKKEVEVVYRCDLPDQNGFFLASCHTCHYIFKP